MKSLIEKGGNWASFICSLITIATMIWYGGALANTVKDQGHRLETIESKGSAAVQTHIASDDERERAVEARISQLEKIVQTLPESLASLREDVREIKTEVRNIRKTNQ